MADSKEHAHELIERLPAPQLSALVALLEAILDPAAALARAPVDEADLTPETAAALDRARASLARGQGIPHEEILREFGLNK
ncbi:MAG TPA: hypothetical protein VJW51_08455 [Candidatus Acidoferrales bacterium]|nr:hypothetical protein [Candidatus Acidoferrales bacterium]